MPDDEEAQDAIDVQPAYQSRSERVKSTGRALPWQLLVVGIVASSVIMTAITISTIPLSILAAPLSGR